MAKMNKTWVVLCSTALSAVYATGYFSTEAQANKLDIHQQVQINHQTKSSMVAINSNQLKNNQVKDNQVKNNQLKVNPPSHKQQPVVQKKQVYKDGTFTGLGQNRRGYIQVAVTLKNDKITDVEIQNFGMHYSERDVVGLPDEVLRKQNAQVNNVSGATYSTQAFQSAVQQAIDQAKNA